MHLELSFYLQASVPENHVPSHHDPFSSQQCNIGAFCKAYLDRGTQLSAWSSVHSCDCAPQSASRWPAGSRRCTATPSERTQWTSCTLTELPQFIWSVPWSFISWIQPVFTFPCVILERQATSPAIAPPWEEEQGVERRFTLNINQQSTEGGTAESPGISV